jgi:cell wall-associated NlpC family hydrolase
MLLAGTHRAVPRLVAMVFVAAIASGCTLFRAGPASDPSAREQSSAAQQGAGAAIARQALAQVGAPYRYGGAEPARGFDCSGLVTYAHGLAGIGVPRTSGAQFAAARKVDPDDLRPGDLVFFRLVPGSREITHVGIYTGQGRFVHAPQTGKRVSEASLEDPYYRERFAGAGRLYPEGPGDGPWLQSSPR